MGAKPQARLDEKGTLRSVVAIARAVEELPQASLRCWRLAKRRYEEMALSAEACVPSYRGANASSVDVEMPEYLMMGPR